MSLPGPSHPDRAHSRADSAPPAVEAYLDARGTGRPAKSMLDQVCRDASVLDDLARDREWIDQVRLPASAPDQTDRILGRLGVERGQFNRRRHRFALLSRRFSAAAVLVLAFVVGMWGRSALMPAPVTPTVETAHRLERVIESLPIQMDPLVRMRGIMLEAGSTLLEPDSPVDPSIHSGPATRRSTLDPRFQAPVRAMINDHHLPELDPSGLINEDIDVESLNAIYREMGIV